MGWVTNLQQALGISIMVNRLQTLWRHMLEFRLPFTAGHDAKVLASNRGGERKEKIPREGKMDNIICTARQSQ
jgi:hypothetical protein